MKKLVVILVAVTLSACAPTRAPVNAEAAEDARTIEQLRKAGTDLTKPHLTRFYLYFPDERSARAAKTELPGSAYVVARIARAARGTDWLLLLKRPTLLSAGELSERSRELTVLAAKHGGAYDGWEAEVRK
ncbi:ribonuclease E inhibitor RraB [Ramlibacter sp. AN1133]|uniref:ribonuclease E inhibitor RraB n=1 Tax=Ramlibacter sp. AN1133 TaxID=3133429 RepID=UPI0030C401DB